MRTGVSPIRIATRNIWLSGHGSSISLLFLRSASLRKSFAAWPDNKLAFLWPFIQLLLTNLSFHCWNFWFINNLIVKQPLLLLFLRKEVIQPHLPIRLPCYDFTPVIDPAFGSSLRTVGSLTSGVTDSHGVTGGVYKTRERIHRDILIRDY